MPLELNVVSLGLLLLALVVATAMGGAAGRRIRAWRLRRSGSAAGPAPASGQPSVGIRAARPAASLRPRAAADAAPGVRPMPPAHRRSGRRRLAAVGLLGVAVFAGGAGFVLTTWPSGPRGAVLDATGTPDEGLTANAAGTGAPPAGEGSPTASLTTPDNQATGPGGSTAAGGSGTTGGILPTGSTSPGSPTSAPGTTRAPTPAPPGPTPPPTPRPTATPTPGPTPTPAPTPTTTAACGAPSATFTYAISPASRKAPVTISVTDTSTSPDCAITAWLWTWGDGTTSSGSSPGSHSYASTGTYPVTLEVTNAGGTGSSNPVRVVVR